MKSILVLGFLLGMRHALEADHLAAVAALATRSKSVRSTVFRGAVWGLGHTLTLLVVGGVCLLLGTAIPERWSNLLEIGVGVMLLGLGTDVLLRARRQRVHVHTHGHDAGVVHLHAHRHAPAEAHDPARHEHPHPERFPFRALLVGVMHGLSGTAAVLLLALKDVVGSPWLGLAYIALFGLGSVLGMAALSLAIALPLGAGARRLAGAAAALEVVVGITALVVGVRLIARVVSTL